MRDLWSLIWLCLHFTLERTQVQRLHQKKWCTCKERQNQDLALPSAFLVISVFLLYIYAIHIVSPHDKMQHFCSVTLKWVLDAQLQSPSSSLHRLYQPDTYRPNGWQTTAFEKGTTRSRIFKWWPGAISLSLEFTRVALFRNHAWDCASAAQLISQEREVP